MQQALIGRALGVSEEDIAEGRAFNERVYGVLKEEEDNALAEEKIREIWTDILEQFSITQDRQLIEAALEAQLPLLLSPWFRFLLTYDPAPALQQVKVPVLAINGEKDLQVPPKENLSAIEAALKAGDNPDFTLVELPNLNHLFQNSTTGSPFEYAQIEETIAPVVLELIADWIATRTPTPSTAVLEEHVATLPQGFALEQNFPNPFNGYTAIRFALPQSAQVELALYNMDGQKVATLIQDMRLAGVYTVRWDGRDNRGRKMATGTYLYRLQTGDNVEARKLLLLR